MQHHTHRLIHVIALVSIAALCLGSGCSSPTSGGTGGSGGTAGAGGGAGGAGGGTANAIEGTYLERFSCQLDDGTCLEVNELIEMEVKLLASGDYQIDDLGSNAIATGTRTGDVLNWTNMDPDFPAFSERGAWAFTFRSGSTTFVKDSEFMQAQVPAGTCVGNGRLKSEGEPDDAPPFMPPCTPQ